MKTDLPPIFIKDVPSKPSKNLQEYQKNNPIQWTEIFQGSNFVQIFFSSCSCCCRYSSYNEESFFFKARYYLHITNTNFWECHRPRHLWTFNSTIEKYENCVDSCGQYSGSSWLQEGTNPNSFYHRQPAGKFTTSLDKYQLPIFLLLPTSITRFHLFLWFPLLHILRGFPKEDIN